MKITNDDFWEIINNYDQIQFAEIKSSVVVSVYSVLFTVAYTIDILMMKIFILSILVRCTTT